MFIDLAKNRFSCRSYKSKPVEEDKIQKIIEAARIAPSANNKQPWYFYVVSKDKDLLNKIHNAYHREWFNDAPVVVVACADIESAWVRKSDQRNHAVVDVSIAIDHITLAATDLELSTCWICNFDIAPVKEALNLSSKIEPIALIPVGYCNTKADVNRFVQKRKTTEEIAKFL